MARKKFTFEPMSYYMKPNRFGHRREIQFAILTGISLLTYSLYNRFNIHTQPLPKYNPNNNLYEKYLYR